MEMNSGSINFIIWMTKNTSSIQSNVRCYKNVYYFTDRASHVGNGNAGIKQLWDVYVKEMVG